MLKTTLGILLVALCLTCLVEAKGFSACMASGGPLAASPKEYYRYVKYLYQVMGDF
jgi:hypothetical protein